jgi:hypothetical protein
MPAFSPSASATIVYTAEFGSAPSASEVNVLVEFLEPQFAFAQQIGVMDPAIYAFEALGVALASTAVHFQNTFGPNNPNYPASTVGDVLFVVDAYAHVFGHAGSAAQVQHFVDQVNYFEALYTAAGVFGSASNIELLARGAIFGQMLGIESIPNGTVNVRVDEDELMGLSTGNTDGDAATTVAIITDAEILSLVNIGTDEPGTVSLNPNIDGVDTGLFSKGENILYQVIDASSLQGLAHGDVIFTLLDNGNGTWTFTLIDQIDHSPVGGGGDNEKIVLSLSNVFIVTDFDGDSVVVDDGPTVTIEDDVPVNNLATLNVSLGTTNTDATITDAQILSLVNIGADEPGTVSLNPNIDLMDTGLQSKGEDIVYRFDDPSHLNGEAGGRTVFVLVDNGIGGWTFTLLDQIDNPFNLSLNDVFKVTDFDGDSVVVDPGPTITLIGQTQPGTFSSDVL